MYVGAVEEGVAACGFVLKLWLLSLLAAALLRVGAWCVQQACKIEDEHSRVSLKKLVHLGSHHFDSRD